MARSKVLIQLLVVCAFVGLKATSGYAVDKSEHVELRRSKQAVDEKKAVANILASLERSAKSLEYKLLASLSSLRTDSNQKQRPKQKGNMRMKPRLLEK